MKKKLILLGGALMLAVVAVTFVSASNNESKASLLMQNVEALARGEDFRQECKVLCNNHPEWECYLILSDGNTWYCGDGVFTKGLRGMILCPF